MGPGGNMKNTAISSLLLIGFLSLFAAQQEQCPSNCSGNGECVKGVCICLSTHTGADCSQEIARAKYHFTSLSDGLPESPTERILKVLLVTTEIVGPVSNGGIGTAFTSMAHSLNTAGHKVTILFTMGPVSQHGPFEEWVDHYAQQGIELVGLYRPPIRYLPKHMLESYEVTRFLRDRSEFDLVHFHDYFGAGYYPMLAKQQGDPALKNMRFIAGLHGPNLWAKGVGNQETIDKIGDLEMDYMERKTVEMADYVISPSRYLLEWMSKEGWPVNPASYVQPNILPVADRQNPPGLGGFELDHTENQVWSPGRRTVDELVFFGRLETRKGVVMFCDAVEQLLRPAVQGLLGDAAKRLQRITFLGRGAMVHGQFGVTYVQDRAQKWGIPWKVISRLGPVEAKAYLREGSRLAVMPSRIENSPYTVYECAELGIPFIASNVGGVADLLDPRDHAEVLFQPTLDALVARLVSALANGVIPARPKVAANLNELVWQQWHLHVASLAATENAAKEAAEAAAAAETPFVSVVITHYNRPHLLKFAVESLRNQDYPTDRFEVVLYDDLSTDPEVFVFLDDLQPDFDARGWTILRSPVNQYLGAARNTAIKSCRGEYVLFMDDDNYAKPHEIGTFVRAMTSSGADILTSFVDFFWGEEAPDITKDRPSYIFLGGSADVGAFKNCFGDANSFVRKTSFEACTLLAFALAAAIGGYTTDHGVGFEDWELYANASLRGFKVDIVPEAVYCYRFTKGSMQKSTNYYVNRKRSLRPYLESLPESLHSVILNAVFPRRSDGSIGPATGLASEGASRFPGADNIIEEKLASAAPPASTGGHDEL
ncbi:hypothetical protein CYMTET_30320 [Cymbomonas tetramitiformis]|uniref:Glycosyltransferase n=1 Tax=Cymbomonas tetramitiformis TaxID=36881 RepID=A0AAE0FJ70_9CHLO|nr:hypothetical protein CYMTET_30320 [Cymbomonas tetramitiformis]